MIPHTEFCGKYDLVIRKTKKIRDVMFWLKNIMKYMICLPLALFLIIWFKNIVPNSPDTYVYVIRFCCFIGVCLFISSIPAIVLFLVGSLILLKLYFVARRTIFYSGTQTKMPIELPRVIILYATCNDFMIEPCLSAINQDYQNTELFILDDSSDCKIIKKINKFAAKYNINVIRRNKKNGWKAGNINNFLQKYDDWEYYLVLDSDIIIAKNFISSNIRLFYSGISHIGLVQGTSSAYKVNSLFTNIVNERVNVLAGGAMNMYLNNLSTFHITHFDYCCIVKKELYHSIKSITNTINSDVALIFDTFTKTDYVGVISMLGTYSTMEPLNFRSFYRREKRWIEAEIVLIKEKGFFAPFKVKNKTFIEKMTFFNSLFWWGLIKDSCVLPLISFPFVMLLSTVGFSFTIFPFNIFNIIFWIIGLAIPIMSILIFCFFAIKTKSIKRGVKIVFALWIYLMVRALAKYWIVPVLFFKKKISFQRTDKYWTTLTFKEKFSFALKFIICFIIQFSLLVTCICINQYVHPFDTNFSLINTIIILSLMSLTNLVFIILSFTQNKQDKKAIFFEYELIYKYSKLRLNNGLKIYPDKINMIQSNYFYDNFNTIKPQKYKTNLNY